MSPSNEYTPHSIGQHIVKFDLVFEDSEKVRDVLNKIRKKTNSWPNTEFIFILDSQRHLIGAVNFKNLIKADPGYEMRFIMDRSYISVTDHSHQSHVAKMAIKSGFEIIPVVNKEGRFLGIIDAGQILKILHENHIEELMHFSGIIENEAEILKFDNLSVGRMIRARLPWLALGLIGGMFATKIISFFNATLEKELSLAFFIPVIVYINAAVGAQTQTIFVRLITLEKVNIKRFIIQEIKVAVVLATFFALSTFALSRFWLASSNIGHIVSAAMFVGIITSVIIGTLIPWILYKLKRDPAVGSGPFATVLQDILSVFIYFSIAKFLLG